MKSEPANVRELLEAVSEGYRGQADAQGRAIDLDVPEGLVASVDPLRIRQAIGNLIDNALRHGEGSISVRAGRDGNVLAISVADQGAGFPPDFVGTAFERFTRADAGRARGGAGLGLAIVQAIASAHGGEARIAEPTGGTAAVVLRLPVLSPSVRGADDPVQGGARR